MGKFVVPPAHSLVWVDCSPHNNDDDQGTARGRIDNVAEIKMISSMGNESTYNGWGGSCDAYKLSNELVVAGRHVWCKVAGQGLRAVSW